MPLAPKGFQVKNLELVEAIAQYTCNVVHTMHSMYYIPCTITQCNYTVLFNLGVPFGDGLLGLFIRRETVNRPRQARRLRLSLKDSYDIIILDY